MVLFGGSEPGAGCPGAPERLISEIGIEWRGEFGPSVKEPSVYGDGRRGAQTTVQPQWAWEEAPGTHLGSSPPQRRVFGGRGEEATPT